MATKETIIQLSDSPKAKSLTTKEAKAADKAAKKAAKRAKKAAKKAAKETAKEEEKDGSKTSWPGARIDRALKALLNSESFTRFSTLCYLGILAGLGVDIKGQYMLMDMVRNCICPNSTMP